MSPFILNYKHAFYIGITFCVIYLLSFNGIPISDDEQLFAITARNISVVGRFDAAPLYGNMRLLGQYKAEPLHPLLASIWYQVLSWFSRNGLQSFYLLPIIYLSISAVLLFILITHFGYPIRFALEMVFWCGFSTIIWPYSQTFFREPLLLMLLIASWLFFEKIFTNGSVNNRYVILFFTAILALIATKVAYGIVVIPYFLMALQKKKKKLDNKKVYIIWILGFAGLFFYLYENYTSVFYRYTLPAWQEYWQWIITLPRENFLQTILLSLFSLWKGFFVYSPICLFIFLIPLSRSNVRAKFNLAFLPIFVFTFILLFQVITYGNDIWTPPWSVRFLVPLIPILIVAALPILEDFYLQPVGKKIIRSVGVLGVIVQLNAIFISSSSYTSYLMEKSAIFPQSEYWNLSTIPAFHQWQLLFEDYPVNLMIFRVIRDSDYSLPAYFFILCGVLLIAFLLISLFSKQNAPTLSYVPEIGILSITFLMLFSFISTHDPFYQELKSVVEQTCQEINIHKQKNSIVVIQPYPSSLWSTFANQDCIHGNWYSLSQNQSIGYFVDSVFPLADLWLIRDVNVTKSFQGEHLPVFYELQQKVNLDNSVEIEFLHYNPDRVK